MKKPTNNQKIKKLGNQQSSQEPMIPQQTGNSGNVITQGKKEIKKKINWSVSRKESDKKVVDKGSLMRFIHMALQFLRESRMELRKVKWPTRKELLASTAVVITLVLVVALFLFLIDFGFSGIIKTIVP